DCTVGMDGAGDSTGGRLRLLLASSSLAALLIGGGTPAAFAPGVCDNTQTRPGNAAPVSQPAPPPIHCITIQNNFTVTGSVSNAGVISTGNGAPPTTTGITINNSVVTGTVTNSGTISGAAFGMRVRNNATLSGGITNSGAFSGGLFGIY